MNITQLKYFLKTAELLNYTKAADELLIARQSLRQSIATLEDEIGKALFINKKNKLQLTEYGIYVQTSASSVVKAFDQMQQNIFQMANQVTELKVGYSTNLFPFILPNNETNLKSFSNQFKNVNLSVLEMSSDNVFHAITNGDIDIGCVLEVPYEHEHLVRYPLAQYKIALSFSGESPFHGKRYITVEDLSNVSCIGFGSLDTILRPIMEDCERRGCHFPYEVVPSTLDAFYKVEHEGQVIFNIFNPSLPNFDWNYTAVLEEYTWQLSFLYSKHAQNSEIKKIFCDYMKPWADPFHTIS